MVDVGDKPSTRRSATASGRIVIPKLAFDLVTSSYPVEDDDTSSVRPNAARTAFAKVRRKGDALTIAQLAAIMGAKQTSALIPLCHPLFLTNVDVKLVPETQRSLEDSAPSATDAKAEVYSIACTATVTCEGRTGVEMEALTAVTIGLLTVWDMLKAVAGKEMEIGGIMVVRKCGGQSGDFERRASDS